MKTVVCYGDSNTWGYRPDGKGRYPFEKRWTSVLQKELGDDFFVIPEGLNGRTTVYDDPLYGFTSGLSFIEVVLNTHKPIDLFIILLGTNDLKPRYNLSAYEIADGVGRLVQIVKSSDAGPDNKPPEILLIAPPPILKAKPSFWYEFMGDSVEKSKMLGEQYKRIADEYGVNFLNAGDIISSSTLDGIHWDENAHRVLGIKVAKMIKKLL